MFHDNPNFKKYPATLCSKFESSKDSQNLNNPPTCLHSLLLKTHLENQFLKFWVEKKQLKIISFALEFLCVCPKVFKT